MRAATVHEIKQELSALKPAELINLHLRLARFKKENKELLTYLLFEATDEEAYINGIKKEIDGLFEEINTSHLYFAKKSLRKILRIIGKYCRYTTAKETEIALRLHFCEALKESGIPVNRNTLIHNINQAQVKKIQSLIKAVHEDLQYEYNRQLKELE